MVTHRQREGSPTGQGLHGHPPVTLDGRNRSNEQKPKKTNNIFNLVNNNIEKGI
jgi:hypothetical protein